jgi:hypothetical protein
MAFGMKNLQPWLRRDFFIDLRNKAQAIPGEIWGVKESILILVWRNNFLINFAIQLF